MAAVRPQAGPPINAIEKEAEGFVELARRSTRSGLMTASPSPTLEVEIPTTLPNTEAEIGQALAPLMLLPVLLALAFVLARLSGLLS